MKVMRAGPVLIIKPRGQVNEYNDAAHAELMRLIEEIVKARFRRELLVLADLSEVTFINSTGLGNFMIAYVSAITNHGRFALCVGPESRVRSIIQVCKLDCIFEVYDTLQAGLRAFGTDEEAITV